MSDPAVERAISDLGLTENEAEDEPLLVLGDPTEIAVKYEPHLYERDPVGWVEEQEFLWSVQEEIAGAVATHRYVAVPSAHDTGKSFIASRIACWWIDVFGEEGFVVTTAPTWNQVHAILWREMRQAKAKRNLRGRTTLDARWYIGGKRAGDELEQLVAFGRKPADYDQAAFQGIHAKYVLVIADEASGIPRLLYDAIDSLATNEYARVLAIGNPDDPASEFANICKPGSGWHTIPVSAFDTPAFTGEKVPESLLDLLVSEQWVEERKRRWGEASPTYQSKVLGIFPDIGDDTLIPPKLIREAEVRDLSRPKQGLGQDGWDIARYGSDKTVGYNYDRGLLRRVYEGEKKSTMETTGHIAARTKPHNGGRIARVDVVGVGSGVVDRLREQGIKGIVAFNAGTKPIEPHRFVDRRAEVFWTFREMLEAGEIDLAPPGEEEDLKAQLGAIKWGVDSKGRTWIESKKDAKKRGLPSPDHADAAVMAAMPNAVAIPSAEERAAMKKGKTLTGDLLEKEM